MYLRRCLQEVRMRLGESDLFLTGDDSDADKRESQDRLPPAGAELAVARVQDAHLARALPDFHEPMLRIAEQFFRLF